MIRSLIYVLVALVVSPWLLAGAMAPSPGIQDSKFDHSHSAWTTILEGSVDEAGLVDYAALRKSPAALDGYLATLAKTTPAEHAKWTRDQRFAFWILSLIHISEPTRPY